MVRDRRIIILATVVAVNWNTLALRRDVSEILLIRKGVQKRETRTTCGNHLLVLSLDKSYLPLQWSRVG